MCCYCVVSVAVTLPGHCNCICVAMRLLGRCECFAMKLPGFCEFFFF